MYLYLLCSIFGYKGWKKYIDYFYHFLNTEFLFFNYIEYLEYVRSNSLQSYGYKWRLNEKELDREMKFANAEHIDKDKKTLLYQEIRVKFHIRNFELQNYVFKKYGYEIVLPKDPENFVNEANSLNNCIRNYIIPYANYETTILFIRRSYKPDSPFFDLEISDGKVKQCHGKNNSSICDYDPHLCLFLDEFCDEKQIKFSRGTQIYAANQQY